MKTKIFAAYLPQFHQTKENDMFWGEGFTDWVNVKNAKPQYQGHIQPKVPQNKNYYDLTNVDVIRWQAELAAKYGVNGFNIYHYWFKDGVHTLYKPAEILLAHKDIKIQFFFSWDNCSWVRTWGKDAGNAWSPVSDKGKSGNSRLLELDYGNQEQWKKHFMYLLPFFKDERYLKINGKPIFAFMTSFEKGTLVEMCEYWKKLAVENGLDGLYLISRHDEFYNKHLLDNQFFYQPPAAAWGKRMSIEGRLKKYFHIVLKQKGNVKYSYDYDFVWKRLLRRAEKERKNALILGGIVAFDDTPRRGSQARMICNSTPEKFKYYFKKLYRLCCENNKELLLLTAWNEWGEGAYLEPDEENGLAYLEALKSAVDDVNGV